MTVLDRLTHHVSSSFLDDTSMHSVSVHSNMVALLHSPDQTADERKHNDKTKLDSHLVVSFAVVYTMIFFNGCCFTAVVPSVPFYLEYLDAPPTFLGWVVSFYSVGQLVGSPIAGWLLSNMNISSRSLLTLSSVLGLISSLLYAVAPYYELILFSRLLTGISAGMEFTTELTFIANNTTMKQRTTYLASVTACNVVGFIMGPALGTVLAIFDVEILGGLVVIDQYTGPGWLLAAMFLLDLIMVRFLFIDDHVDTEYDSASSGDQSSVPCNERARLLQGNNKERQDTSYGGLQREERSLEKEADNDVPARLYGDLDKGVDDDGAEVEKEAPPSLRLVSSLIFVQFTVMCGFSVLETITSPLVQDQFDWSVQDCNLLFTCGGLVSLAAYVACVLASKWVQDRWLVLYALTLCFAGFMLAIDWQQLDWMPRSGASSVILPSYLYRFLAAFLVMNAGFMTGRPVTFALYSKLISPQYQGQYLSFMVAGGSAARTLGPFATVSLYYGISSDAGENLLALFGLVGAFHFACLVLVLCQWPQLQQGNLQPVAMSFTTTTTAAESDDEK